MEEKSSKGATMPLSESRRTRQVHRYLRPWRQLQSILYADSPGSALNPDKFTREDALPVSSSDKALTAFAQLAALRLDMTRVIISLIDKDKEYILAEATQTISLMMDSRHDKDDQLALGLSEWPRSKSLSANALTAKTTVVSIDTGKETTIDAFVLQNALQDPELCNHEFVKQFGVRFYASVPILTKHGIKIGTYSVFSQRPKAILTGEEFQFLQDVSATVFEHLVLIKGRLDSFRGAKMVQGLTSFVTRSEKNDRVRAMLGYEALTASSGNGERSDVSEDDQHSSDSDNPPAPGKVVSPRSSIPDMMQLSPEHQPAVDAPSSPRSSSSLVSASKTKTAAQYTSNNPHTLTDSKPAISLASDSIDSSMRKMFKQAAKTLRKSIDADGCIFFDATSKAMRGGANGTNAAKSYQSEGSVDNSEPELTATSSRASRKSSVDRSGTESGYASGYDNQENGAPAISEVLGLSLASAGLDGNSGSTTFTFNEIDLKRCIQRYPRGKIFNFNDEGIISSGEDTLSNISGTDHASRLAGLDDEAPEAKMTPHQRKQDSVRIRKFVAEELINILPGARSVIFFPLWDLSENKWCAGAFLWTTQQGFLMDSNDEFPYLRAFANTIMSEVSRLGVIHSDRAKTTFIASISHELRSPLHGILGSVEFLHDTELDSFQQGLVASVDTCGKTLLDTIDHVLDYAKINSFGSKAPNRSRRIKGTRSRGSNVGLIANMSLTKCVDLSVLVEEVADAIYAGQTFRTTKSEDFTKTYGGNNSTDPALKSNMKIQTRRFYNGLTVVLDVDKVNNWNVITQPGALRRIVMNIFGNALKYTEKGLVKIHLKCNPEEHKRRGKLFVELIVTDTGKGMSADFLRNRLYKPFSQEDPFSAGTGLGLSIVRQIVSSLNGNIQVSSEQNKGTEIRIALTLPSADGYEDLQRQQISTRIGSDTVGMTCCILQCSDDTTTTTLSSWNTTVEALKELLTNWYGFHVIFADNMDNIEADFFLYPEPPSIQALLDEHDVNTIHGGEKTREEALIIICSNASEAAGLKAAGVERLTELGRTIEVISQPCGPIKIARAIEACFTSKRKIAECLRSTSTGVTSIGEISIKAPPVTVSTGFALPSLSTALNNVPPLDGALDLEAIQGKHDYVNSEKVLETPMSSDAVFWSCATPIVEKSPVGPSVLVVDDNPINLQLLMTFMRKTGLPYSSATNGLEAYDAFTRQERNGTPFDFVLMDISMPVMNGIKSTEKMREYERERGCKRATIVALTGMAGQATQNDAFQGGFDLFFSKPVRFKQLRQLLLGQE